MQRRLACASASREEPDFARLIDAAATDSNASGRAREPARRQRLHASFTAKLRLSFTANEAARGAGSHPETFHAETFSCRKLHAEDSSC
jgi:hypothetical protein